MNEIGKTFLATFLSANLMILATTSKAISLGVSFSRLLTGNNEGELFVASSLEIIDGRNIYVMDGFNNSLQVANVPFNHSPNNSQNQTSNIYLVDGINNHFQISTANNNLMPSQNNNHNFRWFKDLSVDGAGNSDRTNQISFSGTDNLYLIDGINKSLQTSNSNNDRVSSTSNSERKFRWIKTLSLDKAGNIYRSNEIISSGTNNIYVGDGINNKLQASNFNNKSILNNIYIVDGINNSLQVGSKNNKFFDSNNNQIDDFENGLGTNFFAELFGNQQPPDDNFLTFLANLFNNNSSLNNPKNFSNIPFLSEFITSNNSFMEIINTIFGNNNWLENITFDEAGNFYQFEHDTLNVDATNIYVIDGINNQIQTFDNLEVNNTDNVYLINGINSSLQFLPINPTTDITSVPEYSSVFSLALLGIGTTVYGIRKNLQQHKFNSKSESIDSS